MRTGAALALVIGLLAVILPTGAGAAPALPKNDPFYTYSGSKPLANIKPGTVLKSRTFTFTPVASGPSYAGVQLLYRTTTQLGAPAVTVTSVLKPTIPTVGLVSDQFFYDALDSKCDPSYTLAGGDGGSGSTNDTEQKTVVALLTAGYTVVSSDYEGEDLAWTAGGQSGRQTLDGIRAALASTDVGLPATTKVGLMGYSGGAIASEWATELAPKYAPDVNARLVGTAIGGIYVYPAHNLNYVGGTPMWSGVMPGALLGVSRAFKINLNTYASAYGKKLFNYAKDKCIGDLLSKYPGLTFAQLVKPQYRNFGSVPAFVKLNNALIMGSGGTPTVPFYMAQGINGEADGTPGNKPGIGPGDGVMIAGDTRSLARKYCKHVAVNYQTYPGEHTSTYAPFFADAVPWLAARFAGVPAPNNCATIPAGNSLAPLPTPRAHTSTASSGSTSGSTSGTTGSSNSGTSGLLLSGSGTDGSKTTGSATTGSHTAGGTGAANTGTANMGTAKTGAAGGSRHSSGTQTPTAISAGATFNGNSIQYHSALVSGGVNDVQPDRTVSFGGHAKKATTGQSIVFGTQHAKGAAGQSIVFGTHQIDGTPASQSIRFDAQPASSNSVSEAGVDSHLLLLSAAALLALGAVLVGATASQLTARRRSTATPQRPGRPTPTRHPLPYAQG